MTMLDMPMICLPQYSQYGLHQVLMKQLLCSICNLTCIYHCACAGATFTSLVCEFGALQDLPVVDPEKLDVWCQ